MNKIRTISILGCGWLGTPLGEHLLGKGYNMKGSTTSQDKLEELRKKGITPYHIDVSDKIQGSNIKDFFQADVLVINIPPARRREDIETYHPTQIQNIIRQVEESTINYILFVSSTSVYPNVNGEVNEEETRMPEKGSGKALQQIEKMLTVHPGFQTTVLRLAGLVGYDRLPGRFLANKKQVSNGEAPVNLIHQDDCVGLITNIIQQGKWGSIFNGCAPEHPLRKNFYIQAAEKAGLTPPEFTDCNKDIRYKTVNADKARKELNYNYKYPDPMGMI